MYFHCIMSDLSTQIKLQASENYKDDLTQAYLKFLNLGIQTKKEFDEKNVYIDGYTYEELTFYDRMNNEEYARIITASTIDLISSYEYAKQNKKEKIKVVKVTK